MEKVTQDEMRQFLQFEPEDKPNPIDMSFFLRIATAKVELEVDSNDEAVKFIATLLIGKHFILRGLASRSLSKGYIQANVEGRNITKAYQELVLEAENVFQEYKAFIVGHGRREVSSTNYYTNTTEIDPRTRQEIIDIMTGTTNVSYSELARRYDYFYRR